MHTNVGGFSRFFRMVSVTVLFAFTSSLFAAESYSVSDDSSDANLNQSLASGYLIQLANGSDQKLNGTFRVQPDGRVELPYNITVQTGGMTLARFKGEIEKLYRPYFKGTPVIAVSIKQKRYWVEVRGLIARPGMYLVKKDSPLDELISLAGGISEDLQSGYARIEQGKQTAWVDLSDYYRQGSLKDAPMWTGGDRVFFQKERPEGVGAAVDEENARKIHLIGDVKNPGEQTYRANADSYYYLIKSGGPNSSADLDSVDHLRVNKSTGQRELVKNGSIGDIKNIKGGDLLLVHSQAPTTTDKVLQRTSTIAQIVTAGLLIFLTAKTLNK